MKQKSRDAGVDCLGAIFEWRFTSTFFFYLHFFLTIYYIVKSKSLINMIYLDSNLPRITRNQPAE